MFLTNLKAEIGMIQKIAPQAKSGEYFQIWFFSRFEGEKMAAF